MSSKFASDNYWMYIFIKSDVIYKQSGLSHPLITLWVMLLEDRQTKRTTNKQTNTTENIFSFAKETQY